MLLLQVCQTFKEGDPMAYMWIHFKERQIAILVPKVAIVSCVFFKERNVVVRTKDE